MANIQMLMGRGDAGQVKSGRATSGQTNCPVAELRGVVKRYGSKIAVAGVSFAVEAGETVAILGANGAGKTTALSMLLGITEPSEGQVQLFGLPPMDRRVRQRTGVMLQEISVMGGLTVRELLRLFRSYYPRPMSLAELLALTGLPEAELDQRADRLSGGQKRRLELALAMAGRPELLILDEPTVGLDVAAREQLWSLLRQLKNQGTAVLFTTHYLQEAEDEADRILLFAGGKLAAAGTPAEVKSGLTMSKISFTTWGAPSAKKRLASLLCADGLEADAACVQEAGGRIQIRTVDSDRVLRILFRHEQELSVSGVTVEPGRLDEALLRLIDKEEERL